MSVHKGSEELKKAWDQFSQTVEKPCCCPFCQGRRIYWNGYRERSASVLDGDRVVYLSEVVCRRVKCADRQCKRSWTLRPPGLMPDRHYQMCVVASAARRFLFDPPQHLELGCRRPSVLPEDCGAMVTLACGDRQALRPYASIGRYPSHSGICSQRQ